MTHKFKCNYKISLSKQNITMKTKISLSKQKYHYIKIQLIILKFEGNNTIENILKGFDSNYLHSDVLSLSYGQSHN